jgi:hypothetical protein
VDLLAQTVLFVHVLAHGVGLSRVAERVPEGQQLEFLEGHGMTFHNQAVTPHSIITTPEKAIANAVSSIHSGTMKSGDMLMTMYATTKMKKPIAVIRRPLLRGTRPL